MAKKKAVQRAKKRVLKEEPEVTETAVPEVEGVSVSNAPESVVAEQPSATGGLANSDLSWSWFASVSGGRFVAKSEKDFNISVDFGRSVRIVGCSINSDRLGPKCDGVNQVYIRCGAGVLVLEVRWVKETPEISVETWEGP